MDVFVYVPCEPDKYPLNVCPLRLINERKIHCWMASGLVGALHGRRFSMKTFAPPPRLPLFDDTFDVCFEYWSCMNGSILATSLPIANSFVESYVDSARLAVSFLTDYQTPEDFFNYFNKGESGEFLRHEVRYPSVTFTRQSKSFKLCASWQVQHREGRTMCSCTAGTDGLISHEPTFVNLLDLPVPPKGKSIEDVFHRLQSDDGMVTDQIECENCTKNKKPAKYLRTEAIR